MLKSSEDGKPGRHDHLANLEARSRNQQMGNGGFTVRLRNRHLSSQEMLADMVRVAELSQLNYLTAKVYDELGICDPTTVARRFGGWTSACRLAGLQTGRPDLGRPDEEFYANFAEVWLRLDHQPTYNDMRGSKISPRTYEARFGSWNKFVLAFGRWAEAHPEGSAVSSRVHLEPPPEIAGGRVPLEVRYLVFERDGYTCQRCRRSQNDDPCLVLHCDHIVPVSKGGKSVPDNLQTLCAACNLSKGDR